MKSSRKLILAALLLSTFLLNGQIRNEEDESRLYAQSKQVNQFFRRFNGEEDEKGKRLYPRDKQYRSEKLRRKFLGTLFDENNAGISNGLKTSFASHLLEKPEERLLDFHQPGWFSEVSSVFTFNGQDVNVTLFMELEQDHDGYKWVIQRVHADAFTPFFDRDTTRIGQFLHPLSHELEFMNLRKAMLKRDSVTQYTVKRFKPDHLSVFLYEIQKGNLKFKTVNEVRFHFFQIEGWYLEVSNFNRPGYNTGWLISNLVKVNSINERKALERFLYHEGR